MVQGMTGAGRATKATLSDPTTVAPLLKHYAVPAAPPSPRPPPAGCHLAATWLPSQQSHNGGPWSGRAHSVGATAGGSGSGMELALRAVSRRGAHAAASPASPYLRSTRSGSRAGTRRLPTLAGGRCRRFSFRSSRRPFGPVRWALCAPIGFPQLLSPPGISSSAERWRGTPVPAAWLTGLECLNVQRLVWSVGLRWRPSGLTPRRFCSWQGRRAQCPLTTR